MKYEQTLFYKMLTQTRRLPRQKRRKKVDTPFLKTLQVCRTHENRREDRCTQYEGIGKQIPPQLRRMRSCLVSCNRAPPVRIGHRVGGDGKKHGLGLHGASLINMAALITSPRMESQRRARLERASAVSLFSS